jgi:putative ABC transport system permease protein
MLKNYIKVAFRGLWRNKVLSFVNIAGLSIGLACVMLIMLFVNDEFSFDKFQTKGKRIFRLVSVATDSTGKEYPRALTGVPQGPGFAEDIPEIESFCRIKSAGWHMITKIGNNVSQAEVLYADTSFSNIFSFAVLEGSAKHLLDGRNSVVLTDAQAKKSFGKQNPIGKIVDIQVDSKFEPFIVTGVVKNAPINSTIQFDMLIPFERSLPADSKDRASVNSDWNSSYLNTFYLLHSGADAAKAQQKFAQSFLKNNGEDWAKFKKHYGKNITKNYYLEPFLNMHLMLDSKKYGVSNGLSNPGDIQNSYILSLLGLLILAIACINFINIMLARSVKRNKEIGVRKVSGGSKAQLVYQFLSESAVITAIVFIPAIILVQLFLPVFSQLANKHFNITYLFQAKILLLFFCLWALVSFMAGFYPAFVASGFNPVDTLYGRFKLSGKNMLGKSLVVLQFVIALTLIISTIVFQRQFTFMTQSYQGYKTENVIRLELPYNKPGEVQLIKNELAKQSSIQLVGGKAGDYNKTIFAVNNKETDWTYFEYIDDNYLQVLQVPLVKGRYLSYRNPSDTVSACLVNESFVSTYLDASRSPIGQLVGKPATNKTGKPMEVVGVVKNYHLNSFKEQIEPVYFSLDNHGYVENLLIKYQPGQAVRALQAIQATIKKVLPYNIISYSYLDDWNKEKYTSVEQWKKIVSYAAVIAIIISSLGLFALTTLAIEQRVKEIGIRKVLGASITNITALLSASFLKLVVIAFLLAVPVSWYFMNNWLQDFAYRIVLSWWIFALSAIATILLALLTVSYHTLRAATANPVNSLRRD